MPRILIIDDEESICWALQRALEHEGHEVAVASSAEDGMARAADFHPHAIVIDVKLPGMDGLTALSKLKQLTHDAPIVVITAYGNLKTAVRAMEGGAFDYLAKPFDLQQALDCIERALRRRAAHVEVIEAAPEPADDLIGQSPAMQVVFKRIALVAPRDACVLITGESGTGKELVARAIHRHSARKARPFLPVHVAALNPNLVESELFGHVKGAFTGAAQSRPGLLALAEGGTVFLDELADIPLPVQAKLLRVLEHNEVLPVGGTQMQPLNVRVLAATHQDLAAKIAEGSFRHDLFYRLNVFQIHLPPLRDRLDDVAILARHFLRQIAPQGATLPEGTVAYLRLQPWHGNVRELRNALEHAAIVARDGPILPEHFPPPLASGPGGADFLDHAIRTWLRGRIREAGDEKPRDLYAALIHAIEGPLLAEVIARVRGNRWEAGRWLGLNRATVRKKLRQHGLDAGAAEDGED